MTELSVNKSLIIGTKQVRNALKEGRVSRVYIASDSDSDITSPIAELAQKRGVEIFYVQTRKELGSMCKIGVKTACAAEVI